MHIPSKNEYMKKRFSQNKTKWRCFLTNEESFLKNVMKFVKTFAIFKKEFDSKLVYNKKYNKNSSIWACEWQASIFFIDFPEIFSFLLQFLWFFLYSSSYYFFVCFLKLKIYILIHIRPADFRKQDFFWPKGRLSMYLTCVISIDSVWRKYENYYPKVFLEKYNFIVLEKNVSNFNILHNLDSDDFD